jgi:dihydroorotase
MVSKEQILSKCNWSPFEGYTFSNSIDSTFVNGELVYSNGQIIDKSQGSRLSFNR